ncbi:inosine-5'-monophosphate dehydrogenase [Streptacidiphilus pinicola]|uniref:Inosine-5'-monophosphate dehydrogenase n=1 Tax=Streptacidiphilus pinicola TaxID=2219663 RepID=A0A2X0J983_9ACTN|nr:CBS domain-containing protein [Streptacidiphilus pinicola]RAG86856.1 inosine-5'-monophosphate dehydrogenase [Streptacidiphilus pinicola]
MRHRIVDDLMTRDVITVQEETPFKEIAEILTEQEISAVPVLDSSGRLVGLVSEADLIRKEAAQADPGGRGPVPRSASEFEPGVAAATARDVMSAPVLIARSGWSVVETARAMKQDNVKRLPVVDDTDHVIGMVSRRDLLRVFLRSDRAIREEIEYDVLRETLALDPGTVQVHVVDGVVSLEGKVPRRSLVPVVERLCRGVDGVVGLESRLAFVEDDSSDGG